MAEPDPITVATIWHFVQRVCREMRETMVRTATNALATTLHDLGYGIWDAGGRVIAIPQGFPCRLISSTFPIRAVMEKYRDNMYPGDEFLTNHPFVAGAVHLPDWVFIRPIYYQGELVFFSCMGTHVPDNGGAKPGGHFLAGDPVAEGLNIPPVKIVEKGKMNEDLLDLILCNNRLPDMMRREIHSLIGSTSVAERRLTELLDRYGKETVLDSLEEMINRTEKAVRAEIAKWPDGTYAAEAQTDDDGVVANEPVTVRCTLTISGDEATFDFSESDAQRRGNINAVYPVTLSDTMAAVFMFLGTELSAYHNEGSLRPIHVIAKEGTVVHCKPGSLTAATPAVTGAIIIESVISALSKALPEKAMGCYGRLCGPGMRVGKDPRTDELYVYVTFGPYGGAGAVYGHDGYQCCCDMGAMGVVSKSDIEEEMVRFPWRVTTYEFLTDSCGPGQWCGAPGIHWEGVNEGSAGACHGGASQGWHIQGQGQRGGYPTPFNKCYLRRDNEEIELTYPRHTDILPGDWVISKSGGGSGVGPPEERDPESVRMDVKNELVSLEAARSVYKVVLDPDSLDIDHNATQKLRGN